MYVESLFLLFVLLLPFSVRTHKLHSTPFGVEDKLAAQFTYVFVSAPTHYKGKGKNFQGWPQIILK